MVACDPFYATGRGRANLNRFFTIFRLPHHRGPLHNRPTMQPKILATILGSLLAIGGIALAQRPERDVSGARHPNIAAAQRLTQQAWEKISAAQEANEFDMQGHAAKAKNLLDEANRELKLAAEAANRNRK
jgi:hypothetical protein